MEVLDPVSSDRSSAMAATVEWSYRLLDGDAGALFDRLAACHGGFGVDALGYLAPPGAGNPDALLAELVEASMMLPDLCTDPPRYRILEPMRQVALAGRKSTWLLGACRHGLSLLGAVRLGLSVTGDTVSVIR